MKNKTTPQKISHQEQSFCSTDQNKTLITIIDFQIKSKQKTEFLQEQGFFRIYTKEAQARYMNICNMLLRNERKIRTYIFMTRNGCMLKISGSL